MSTKTEKKWIAQLRVLDACSEALEWCETQPTFARAWAKCERADWLLWLAAKTVDRRIVVAAACACARTALKYVPKGDGRPLRAIETAEAWVRGEASLEEVRAAATAAYATAYAATYATTYAANNAASYATYAANNAASYAAHAAYYAASYAASYAAYATAHAASYANAARNTHTEMCNIVRATIKRPSLSKKVSP